MRVRVYERDDGGVDVLIPAAGVDLDVAEAQARAKGSIPAAAGMEMDAADLPPRIEADADGDPVPARSAWRIRAGKVQIDQQQLPVPWRHIIPRIRESIGDEHLAGVLPGLVSAIEQRDVDLLRAVLRRVAGELTAEQRAALSRVLANKRIGQL